MTERTNVCRRSKSAENYHRQHPDQGQLPGSALVTVLDAERLHIVHFDSDMPAEILDLTYTATALGGQRAWFQCSKLG